MLGKLIWNLSEQKRRINPRKASKKQKPSFYSVFVFVRKSNLTRSALDVFPLIDMGLTFNKFCFEEDQKWKPFDKLWDQKNWFCFKRHRLIWFSKYAKHDIDQNDWNNQQSDLLFRNDLSWFVFYLFTLKVSFVLFFNFYEENFSVFQSINCDCQSFAIIDLRELKAKGKLLGKLFSASTRNWRMLEVS